MENKVQNITVVGAGQMGHQIAMLSALGGYTTNLVDVSQNALIQAEKKLKDIMNKWVAKGKIPEDRMLSAFSRLSFSTELEKVIPDSEFIIEAIVEKLEAKRSLFNRLDKLAPPHAILASNSSTIVNSLIASVTNRKDKVVNMHFFYPPLVMDCVEVVKSEETSEETAQMTLDICKRMNRTGILLHKEISGFIANRILGALHKEAMYLYENGYASFEDIDLICRKALRHPIGPFELMDLSGIDVGYYVMEQRYRETGDESDKPFKSFIEKMEAGELGRKTGKGFYQYRENGVRV
ncbi:3-hydroxyacyl-CoA dehydrogenase [Bacillus coahuilensis m2-6]|uniref:3-hydroxyacyl-CoA dehydrogenase family protein n=1 Tax=Bacillus coahuilensis TaxID=408580 RepID=UPI0007504ABE|nr:3-hydroxyacyl-CoA dehydrogenase family protein [Bacillus coahuilensis]KUP09553.1 3-hydroxyacyl-CoA dehydrogenase [Bacillus coahuilensis m2-6]